MVTMDGQRVPKSHRERKKVNFVDARDIFRDYPLTSDHERSTLDTSDDTLLMQIGETSTMSKSVKSRKPKRVGYASVTNIQKILDIHRNGRLPARLTREKLIE